MKEYKNILIAAVLIIATLVLVYWWGGNGVRMTGWTVEEPTKTLTAEEKVAIAQEKAQKQAEETAKAEITPNEEPEKMAPVEEAEDAVVEKKENTCTISVRCDTILNNMDFLNPDKTGLVPANGIILSEQTITFSEGESVFDVLLRQMQKSGIHTEYTSTPVYNSVYIEGIANLYEFDCGELSGWMYRVNGWFPNYGCSRYKLKSGDKIEWIYTCDLGVDIGGFNATGNNQ